MSNELDPNTPILIGWATVSRREPDHRTSPEAAELMIEAARDALGDTGEVAAAVDWIAVTNGLASYADPGRLVADALGVPDAYTVLSEVGVTQQTLLSEACRRVANGTSQIALVIGGEAKYRDVRATAAGEVATVTEQPAGTEPDERLTPEAELVLPAEIAAGLMAAPGFYALVDSEWRSSRGRSLDDHRDDIAALYSRFSEIAANYPHAVRPTPRTPEWLRDASDANPMVAFPFTKHMVSTWTVDTGTALAFTTVGTATRLGIPESKWIYPAIAVESNYVVPVAARTRLAQPAAMRLMGDAVRSEAGIDPSEIEILDLYSPFPVAVEIAAAGLGVPEGRDLTVTGGMSFGGGPFNSYVFEALVAAAMRVHAGDGEHALVTSVSGLYTKQGLIVLSASPPERPFSVVDVTDAVGEAEPALSVAESADGAGTVVASTVMFAGAAHERAIIVVQLATGERTVAYTHDADVMADVQRADVIGREVSVDAGRFAWADPRPPSVQQEQPQ